MALAPTEVYTVSKARAIAMKSVDGCPAPGIYIYIKRKIYNRKVLCAKTLFPLFRRLRAVPARLPACRKSKRGSSSLFLPSPSSPQPPPTSLGN